MAAIFQTFLMHFLNEKVQISVKISLKLGRKGPINNIPALVKIMAWHRPGHKPLSEQMMASLLTHIYASLGLNELIHEMRDWIDPYTETQIRFPHFGAQLNKTITIKATFIAHQ